MAIIQNTNTSTSPRRYMVETVRGLEQAVQNINRILAIGTEMTDAQIAARLTLYWQMCQRSRRCLSMPQRGSIMPTLTT